MQLGAHFNKNLIIYIWSGTIFSRRPTLGRVWLERCANFTFSIFVFIFFQKWDWRQLHTLGLWTPLREAILWANPLFYLRNLMFFSKPSILLREFDTFRSWLASGAPLGSQGPFWRPSLDCVGRIFGLGSSLGPFFDASGTSSVFFLNFLSPWDQNILQRASITFVLQRDVHLKIFVFCFCKFGFPDFL